VQGQFTQKWKHAGATPTVDDVLAVFPSHKARSDYLTYREQLETSGGFKAKGMSAGNERRRFHGTARECTLGLSGNATLCALPGCNVCSIIRTHFRVNLAKLNFGWGRFGKGIYFTSTSSKSHSYNAKSEKQSGGKATRVMFLTKVAVGKGYKTTQDRQDLTAPPAGHDSVLGETGVALNHDECVVYNEKAALPGYLIVYSY